MFSQLFLVAQLQKIINAPTLEEMREGKEILANEIGVVFKPSGGRQQAADTVAETTGSVDGGIFKHKAAHFEWLLDVAEPLGLGFGDLGKRRICTEATVHFCDELSRLYANEHDATAIAASFAVENWAAAGFWDDLTAGFEGVNARRKRDGDKPLPVAFWTYHSARGPASGARLGATSETRDLGRDDRPSPRRASRATSRAASAGRARATSDETRARGPSARGEARSPRQARAAARGSSRRSAAPRRPRRSRRASSRRR